MSSVSTDHSSVSSAFLRESRPAKRAISYSTASTERIKRVFREYGYGGPVEATLYTHGVSDTYLLSTSDKKFALKVYRVGWRTRDAIEAEMAAIQHAHEKNVAVATPIARRDGQWITYIRAPEGPRACVLFPWAEGRPPRYKDADHAREFGAMVARLHDAEDDFHDYGARPRLDIDYLFRQPVETIKSRLREMPDVAARLELVSQRLESAFAGIEGKLSDWGFCHGDIWVGNARIEANRLVLFDFDFFGLGWRATDLATFRWHARLVGSEKVAWDAFLEGYLPIRPIARESLPFIELFMMARHLWNTAHFLGMTTDFGVTMVSDDYLEYTVAFCEQLEAERSGDHAE